MRKPDFEVNCAECNISFIVKRKIYIDKTRGVYYHNFFCNKKCKSQFYKTGQEINCFFCEKLVYKTKGELEQKSSFCSQQCSALFNNKQRILNGFTTKNKKKILVCNICNNQYIGSIHSPISKSLCEKCSHEERNKIIKDYLFRKALKKDNQVAKRFCKKCSIEIFHCGKYCNKCRNEQASISRIEAIKNGKTNFKSIKCEYKFNDLIIKCDSKIEYACLNYFENNFEVLNIKRASEAIDYTFDGKNKLYLPDFEIITKEFTYIVECKSNIGSKSLNKKWHFYNETAKIKKESLEKWCADNGYKSFWFTKNLNNKYYNSLFKKSRENHSEVA